MTRAGRHPRLRPALLAAVFVGGCLGGAARFAVTDTWPTAAGSFPWPTFGVNCSGALLLALLLVLADSLLPPTAYLRPLLGTGFCGAWTTFSAVVVDADRLIAHDRVVVGAAYVLASAAGGLAAAVMGVVAGRVLAGVARDRVTRSG